MLENLLLKLRICRNFQFEDCEFMGFPTPPRSVIKSIFAKIHQDANFEWRTNKIAAVLWFVLIREYQNIQNIHLTYQILSTC